MTWELDHLSILTEVSGGAGDCLAAAGLTFGSGQAHPGQGTANRRCFFHNAMLELLWVSDPQEAQSDLTQPTYLWERWQGRDRTSPFGIGLRPRSGSVPSAPDFPHSEYRPRYLPDSQPIYLGANAAALAEPLTFAIPFGQRPDAQATQPLQHRLGWRELTGGRLRGPTLAAPAAALAAVAAIANLQLQVSAQHCLELEFDGAAAGGVGDFRPELPLICRW